MKNFNYILLVSTRTTSKDYSIFDNKWSFLNKFLKSGLLALKIEWHSTVTHISRSLNLFEEISNFLHKSIQLLN